MLTTLLVVKRYLGELPRSRASLYAEAVRVLIRTWNVEGYEPLDEEETLAQLSYVACSMMEQGTQRLGHRALLKLLQDARHELAAELAYAKISPAEFIERIEYRSSLLMQTGHDEIDGDLQAVYEFRHLTFQEYLAARGYVKEQHPGRNDGRRLESLLEPHLESERWREVIPLAVVLAGRKAEATVQLLIERCQRVTTGGHYMCLAVLLQCLLDEMLVNPPTLRLALAQMARLWSETGGTGSVTKLRRGKYGSLFEEVAEEQYLDDRIDWQKYVTCVKDIAVDCAFSESGLSMSDGRAEVLAQTLATGSRIERIRAAMVCMKLAWRQRLQSSTRQTGDLCSLGFSSLRDPLVAMVHSGDPQMTLPASWALAWIGDRGLDDAPPNPELLLYLYGIWRTAGQSQLARMAAWALAAQHLLPRDTFGREVWGDCDDWLQRHVGARTRRHEAHTRAALIIGWYRKAPWNDADLAAMISTVLGKSGYGAYGRRNHFAAILATLGEPGRQALMRRNAETT